MTHAPINPRHESYWQRGCDDARSGRPPLRPFASSTLAVLPGHVIYDHNLANQGYMNGHRFGCTRRHPETANEGSEP